jgi:hypothetical protein
MNQQTTYKWQKAILKAAKYFEFMIGQEIWCRMSRPFFTKGIGVKGDPVRAMVYYSNLLAWDSDVQLQVPKEIVELLARGPEDFAEDVPLIPYAEWSQWGKE